MKIGLVSATKENESYQKPEFLEISNAQRLSVSESSALKVELVGEMALT